jgi:uncharacterized protein
MKSKFIEHEICYTGKELAPHWIYKSFNIQGDAIISFVGECEVKITEMVDISDVLANSPIYSKKMVHFIVEHFNIPLIEGVLRQRMLVNIAREVIIKNLPDKNYLVRKGDDLFYNEGKLSVSIAAKSINSVLIHLGINIDSVDAPVHAAGLDSEMNIKNHEEIAEQIMVNYCKECDEIINASCKVRGVI